jgi:hypothetical protein
MKHGIMTETPSRVKQLFLRPGRRRRDPQGVRPGRVRQAFGAASRKASPEKGNSQLTTRFRNGLKWRPSCIQVVRFSCKCPAADAAQGVPVASATGLAAALEGVTRPAFTRARARELWRHSARTRAGGVGGRWREVASLGGSGHSNRRSAGGLSDVWAINGPRERAVISDEFLAGFRISPLYISGL